MTALVYFMFHDGGIWAHVKATLLLIKALQTSGEADPEKFVFGG